MGARVKSSQNTQDRIMEIVSFLLKQILETPDNARCQGRLVKGLEERGYRRSEIDAAIELVLAVPEIISSTGDPDLARSTRLGTRVFSLTEQNKLGVAVRGRLLQYRSLGLLSESECEEVLLQLLLAESPEAGLADLYSAILKVVGDEERLMLLLPGVSQPVVAIIN